MNMNYKTISKGLLFLLGLSLASCASDGGKTADGSTSNGNDESALASSEKTEESETIKLIDSTLIKSAAFDWDHDALKDYAAQNGTCGLSFNLDSLFKHINYDSIIGSLHFDSLYYEDLRVLRSIPYAQHGQWFKEGDLFEKFNSIGSYLDIIKPIAKKLADDQREETPRRSEYWILWEKDYPKTYDLIKLNEKESAFVKRVDEEIEKRKQKRYVKNNGLYLLNVDLAENLNYIDLSNTSAYSLLSRDNFCISETQAEQMYNPYEFYHNMPHYITTDLYLSAYNAYLAWLILHVEETKILPDVRNFVSAMFKQSLKELETCTDENIRPVVEHVVVYYAIANRLFNTLPRSENDSSASVDKTILPAKLMKIYNNEMSEIDQEKDINFSGFLNEQMLYSLFKPRGFYTRNADTKMYFRGMMWLQYAKYRMNNLEIPLYMALQYNRADPSLKKNMDQLNNLLTYLIGDIDNCSIMDLAKRLSSDFGIKSNADIKNKSKLALVKDYLKAENKRCNRIFNRVQRTDTIPELNFMPQRYTPDAEVLMWMCDPEIESARPFPNGLDFLYAFGNPVAGKLLGDYDPTTKAWKDYGKMVDKTHAKFNNYPYFGRSVYEKNLEVLVSLQNEGTQPDYMKTEAWQRKNTNTALASWAELKHTSILYAEQPIDCSETGEGGDEYYLPDPEFFSDIAEPNLKFWEKALELLDQTEKIFKENGVKLDDKHDWLSDKAALYLWMTKKELAGEPINVHLGTGGSYESFCNSLSFSDNSKINLTDIAKVADIYTRQIEGAPDNGILHAGLALVNSIYVVVENNGHTYITEGAVYDYRLTVLPNRNNDDDWRKLLKTDYNQGRQEWMVPYILTGDKRLKFFQNVGNRTSRGWEYPDPEYSDESFKDGWFF